MEEFIDLYGRPPISGADLGEKKILDNLKFLSINVQGPNIPA